MHRIADIKKRREDRFWENRMKLATVQKQVDFDREVLAHQNLVKNRPEKEEVLERIRAREAVREEEKQERKGQQRGRMVVEEEL